MCQEEVVTITSERKVDEYDLVTFFSSCIFVLYFLLFPTGNVLMKGFHHGREHLI